MKKAKIILAVLVVLTTTFGCGVRKKDRCPQVGQANHGMFEKR